MVNQTIMSDFLLDRRISQRHIRDGRLERADLENSLNALPDLADASVEISYEVFGAEGHKVALSGEFVSSEEDPE
jgi:hypothetical protein